MSGNMKIIGKYEQMNITTTKLPHMCMFSFIDPDID